MTPTELRAAYTESEEAREAATRARRAFEEHCWNAREAGLTYAEIGAALRVTRQAALKMCQAAERAYRAMCEEQAREESWSRRMERERVAEEGNSGADRSCQSCHRFKSRPSDRCEHCGDEPGTYNGNARDYDRAMGMA